MPLRIDSHLPAGNVLRQENVFCIPQLEAENQDIRPLDIIILNLMPKKIETEIHLLRMLSNSPLQVNVELMRIDDSSSRHTPDEHIDRFYRRFDDIRGRKYDGMIITGAPLGQLPFNEVRFWPRLTEIIDWSWSNVTSTMFLCWAVQAAMYHLYGIPKHILPTKLSGVYRHQLENPLAPIARGFDDTFDAPHSRYAEVPTADIAAHPDLSIIATSSVAGAYIATRTDGRQVFVTGHSEYEPQCLKDEYQRDVDAGIAPAIPENYFPDDDPSREPVVTWKSHGNLLFSNWLNYHVYQLTPFDAAMIGTEVHSVDVQFS